MKKYLLISVTIAIPLLLLMSFAWGLSSGKLGYEHEPYTVAALGVSSEYISPECREKQNKARTESEPYRRQIDDNNKRTGDIYRVAITALPTGYYKDGPPNLTTSQRREVDGLNQEFLRLTNIVEDIESKYACKSTP